MSHAESRRGALQVRYFTANGFYVLLDNQFNADDTAKAMPGQWVQWWKQVLQDVIADSASRNQVMLDLLNEPDSQFWKWENAGPAYLQAMDALHQVGLFAPGLPEFWTRPARISVAVLAKQPTREPSACVPAAGVQESLSQLSVVLGSLCATGAATAMC